MASSGNDDPRCPECDGPIAATSTYCMHCGADLESESESEGLDDSADVSDEDDVPWGADEDEDAAAIDGGDTVAASGGGTATTLQPDASRFDGLTDTFRRHLGPDGMIDDSLTILVGLVGGFVIGIGTLIVVGIATGAGLTFVVGLVAWLGSTIVLSRQRTVLGAMRLGCYAVAGLLVLMPVAAFSPVASVDGGIVSRAVVFLVGEVVLAIPVAILLVVGFVAGRARPESVRERTAGN